MLGVDNRVGPYLCLTVRDAHRMTALIAKGTPLRVVADVFGTSERTVRRHVGSTIETAIVGEWRLTFLCRRGRPPAEIERLHIR